MSEVVGRQITRAETCALASVRRVAAMLDLDPDGFKEGDALPRGWHFFLMAADSRRSDLRADGFPGLGVPMPDLGLPRLLVGGRSVEYRSDIPIGASVHRTSRIDSLTERTNAAGPMAVVTVAHELSVGTAEPAIVERQTFLLLSAGKAGEGVETSMPVEGARKKEVVPDATMLFQYSALGFNSHKIHLDRGYARDVEGFPDLVVNGGLTTLLLTEFARVDLGLTPASVTVKFIAPLFCDRRMTLAGDPVAESPSWRLAAFDDHGHPAAKMELVVQ
jgi:3-methylfumaryl-CoA hydratase